MHSLEIQPLEDDSTLEFSLAFIVDSRQHTRVTHEYLNRNPHC